MEESFSGYNEQSSGLVKLYGLIQNNKYTTGYKAFKFSILFEEYKIVTQHCLN